MIYLEMDSAFGYGDEDGPVRRLLGSDT